MLRRRIMKKKGEVDYSLQYFTLIALQDTSFTHTAFDVEYSVDSGTTWTTLSANSSTPTIQAGTNAMFRGNITPTTAYGSGTFTGTNNFEAEGNVMSLLYGDDFVGQVDLTEKTFAFYNLFKGASYLKNAKNLSLPATTLVSNCYYGMFTNCTSLTVAPELPATTLANYCYRNMFAGCTSLTTAPELPATTLANTCYGYMFANCTSLTVAPELPATTLIDNCYRNMFDGCTSLTTAPELPATATKQNCYRQMFYDCTKLNYIKAMLTTKPSTIQCQNWVYGVAATGTFVKNSAATWNVTGVNGIPDGWTVETASS